MTFTRAAMLAGSTAGVLAGALVFSPRLRPVVTTLWLSSVVLCVIAFVPLRHRGTPGDASERVRDLLTMGGLLLAFLPLYTLFLYWFPFPISSDEVHIMQAERSFARDPALHLWSTSGYFGFPALVFIVRGWLGEWLGGVHLQTMRFLHACWGMAIIACGYCLFRSCLPRYPAVLGTLVLGSGHALVTLSRMAMRDNSALLAETAALSVLWRGYQLRCPLRTAIGGALAGLGYYVYYPARITMVLWLVFGAFRIIRPGPGLRAADWLRLWSTAVCGFCLMTGPLLLDTWRTWPASENFMRQSSLLHPEGRELQRQWVSARTVEEGVLVNVRQGLGTFNTKVGDHSNIYPNWPGRHGFVDPLTGLLIWAGVVAVLASIRIRDLRREFDPIATGGFVFLWLLFSLVINKAPNYTRLLVILPFVAYLVTRALEAIQLCIERTCPVASPITGACAGRLVAGMIAAGIVIWNLAIFESVTHRGIVSGDTLGGMGRYIDQRKTVRGARYYIVASADHPVFSWAGPSTWESWTQFFAADDQLVSTLPSERMLRDERRRPSTYFMARALWSETRDRWLREPGTIQLHAITPDGRIVAVELP